MSSLLRKIDKVRATTWVCYSESQKRRELQKPVPPNSFTDYTFLEGLVFPCWPFFRTSARCLKCLQRLGWRGILEVFSYSLIQVYKVTPTFCFHHTIPKGFSSSNSHGKTSSARAIFNDGSHFDFLWVTLLLGVTIFPPRGITVYKRPQSQAYHHHLFLFFLEGSEGNLRCMPLSFNSVSFAGREKDATHRQRRGK